MAQMIGMILMPWQQQVADVCTEYDPVTGVPFYREVFVTTPRQQGKTWLILALMLDRCLSWSTPQACVWTGQSGHDIRRKWIQELVPALERSDLAPLIKQVWRGMGSEQLQWQTGSRIELLPNSDSAGHGMVVDFAVLDEIFADGDSRREAALLPAMATRRDAQMLICSTAGTAASTVYNRKVSQGRQAVAEGRDSGVAYFEWSAPDDWDPEDEEVWWEFMPALGHTIDPAVIVQARDTMEPDEFARAYGNRPARNGADVIPEAVWQQVVSAKAATDRDRVTIGVDVTPERDYAAIAIADGSVCELVDYRPGVGWVLERCAELSDRYGAAVCFDGRGPVGALDGLKDLPRAQPFTSPEVIWACAAFFDAVGDRHVTVRQDDVLDRAVNGLQKKLVGDAYCWSRRASSHDVTPLYAATVALAGTKTKADAPYAGPLIAVR